MTKTVLLGTTNPAKIKRFEELLRGYAVQFYTLRDLHIEKEPRETGTTPRENAELKAVMKRSRNFPAPFVVFIQIRSNQFLQTGGRKPGREENLLSGTVRTAPARPGSAPAADAGTTRFG